MNLGAREIFHKFLKSEIVIYIETNKFSFCLLRLRHTSAGDKYVLTLGDETPMKKVILYNSIPRQRTKVQTLVVSTPFVRVTDRMGQPVQCQISPIWIGPAALTVARYELSFLVTVPGFGITTYIIHALPTLSFPRYDIFQSKYRYILFSYSTFYSLLYTGRFILQM